MEIADFRKMEQVRARADAIVKDKATAEALKPWYRQFCKRPCFNDEYLATEIGQTGTQFDGLAHIGLQTGRDGDTNDKEHRALSLNANEAA